MTEVEADIDRLFQLPLAEFTEARNAVAARLRKEGNAEASARVKALAKPGATAWAVNQLYWTARREFDDLVDAGDRLRALQARGVTAGELREAMRDRREALTAAIRKVEGALEAGGHATSAAVMQRLSTTLEALATYGSARPPAIQPGRLTEDLSPPGFEAVTALAAAPPPSAHQRPKEGALATPSRDEAALESARVEVSRAETELAVRRRQVDAAREALAEAARRREGAQAELAEAERRVAKAQERLRETAEAVDRAQAEVEEIGRALAEAERALDVARRKSSLSS